MPKFSFLGLVDVGERACELLCSVAGCYHGTFRRTTARFHGVGWGRKVGVGDSIEEDAWKGETSARAREGRGSSALAGGVTESVQ